MCISGGEQNWFRVKSQKHTPRGSQRKKWKFLEFSPVKVYRFGMIGFLKLDDDGPKYVGLDIRYPLTTVSSCHDVHYRPGNEVGKVVGEFCSLASEDFQLPPGIFMYPLVI